MVLRRPARVRSQPAIIVSASGTAKANRPATPRIAKPSARLASEPPNSSGTQASGSPASSSACQSVSFQRSSLARLMVWGSAKSAKIRAATSATIWLFSPATIGSLVFPSHAGRFDRRGEFLDMRNGGAKRDCWQASSGSDLSMFAAVRSDSPVDHENHNG